MFVNQPEIPVSLAVEFPFPAWATRQSECGDPQASTSARPPVRDPFAGLPSPDDDAAPVLTPGPVLHSCPA